MKTIGIHDVKDIKTGRWERLYPKGDERNTETKHIKVITETDEVHITLFRK